MSILRDRRERIHDLTTSVESTLPVTDTRFFAVYKINSRLRRRRSRRDAGVGARFDVQVNQSLPFLNFSGAQWEMLVAVRNLFRDDCSTRPSTTNCSSCALPSASSAALPFVSSKTGPSVTTASHFDVWPFSVAVFVVHLIERKVPLFGSRKGSTVDIDRLT